jgi:hypothetical protein
MSSVILSGIIMDAFGIRLARPAFGAASILALSALADGKLDVRVSPIALTGQKGVVKLELVNHLGEPVVGAKAACFINDTSGNVVAQGSRWVVAGSAATNHTGLAPGATNTFHFVVGSPQPWASTNLTAKIVFSKVVLQSGKTADVTRDVRVRPAAE